MRELVASNIAYIAQRRYLTSFPEHTGIAFRGIDRNSIRISCANRDSVRFIYFTVQRIGYICNYGIANHLNLMKIITDDLSKTYL